MDNQQLEDQLTPEELESRRDEMKEFYGIQELIYQSTKNMCKSISDLNPKLKSKWINSNSGIDSEINYMLESTNKFRVGWMSDYEDLVYQFVTKSISRIGGGNKQKTRKIKTFLTSFSFVRVSINCFILNVQASFSNWFFPVVTPSNGGHPLFARSTEFNPFLSRNSEIPV